MATNQQPWWKNRWLWLGTLSVVGFSVALDLLVNGLLHGWSRPALVAAMASGVSAAAILFALFRDEIVRYFNDRGGEPESARRFYGPDAPGAAVPVTFWLVGLAAAVLAAVQVPRLEGQPPGLLLGALLVVVQVAVQVIAFSVTRPSPGDRDFLRSLAESAAGRGPRRPSDVLNFFLRHHDFGAVRPYARSNPDFGQEWRRPFAERDRPRDRQLDFRIPLLLLFWLQDQFADGIDPDELRDLRERLEPEPRRDEDEVPSSLLATRAAARVNEELARRVGFVVDDAWQRLKLVLPNDLRRRHLWAESGVLWSRLVAAVALGLVPPFVVFRSWFALVSFVIFGWAVAVGRRRLVRAYELRAATADLYRFDLARRLGIAMPSSQAEFAELGGVLTGKDTDWELTSPETQQAAVDTSRIEEELARTRQEITGEVRLAAERLEHQRGELEESWGGYMRRTDRRLSGLPELIRQSVDEVLGGPQLVNFTGSLTVEHQDVAPPDSIVDLAVEIHGNPDADDSSHVRVIGVNRRAVRQPVRIDGGMPLPAAEFELIVDSATMHPSPRRRTVEVAAFDGRARVEVSLSLPEEEGTHEAWLQLFQSGRLVQAIMVVVEARR